MKTSTHRSSSGTHPGNGGGDTLYALLGVFTLLALMASGFLWRPDSPVDIALNPQIASAETTENSGTIASDGTSTPIVSAPVPQRQTTSGTVASPTPGGVAAGSAPVAVASVPAHGSAVATPGGAPNSPVASITNVVSGAVNRIQEREKRRQQRVQDTLNAGKGNGKK